MVLYHRAEMSSVFVSVCVCVCVCVCVYISVRTFTISLCVIETYLTSYKFNPLCLVSKQFSSPSEVQNVNTSTTVLAG